MRGQWLGNLHGDVPGGVMLDLDDRGDRYTGSALFKPHAPGVPSTVAYIDTLAKADRLEFEAPIRPVDGTRKQPMDFATLQQAFPNVQHATNATLKMEKREDRLYVSYHTAFSSADGYLAQYAPGSKSSYEADFVLDWSEFKAKIATLNPDHYVYRGQSAPWSLQTSFHRAGRFDLIRYVNEDIPNIQREILPHTSIFLDRNSPILTGGLYNLAQHHGFPTPLLDWTYSPYVAAFFAFRNQEDRGSDKTEAVRIFAFNRHNWTRTADGMAYLTYVEPHITFLDLPPIENKRALPQQALAMITNLSNIEQFIRYEEEHAGQRAMIVIDISREQRSVAMRDLRTMGITAASMFPGLDGTFEELRHRLFD